MATCFATANGACHAHHQRSALLIGQSGQLLHHNIPLLLRLALAVHGCA